MRKWTVRAFVSSEKEYTQPGGAKGYGDVYETRVTAKTMREAAEKFPAQARAEAPRRCYHIQYSSIDVEDSRGRVHNFS